MTRRIGFALSAPASSGQSDRRVLRRARFTLKCLRVFEGFFPCLGVRCLAAVFEAQTEKSSRCPERWEDVFPEVDKPDGGEGGDQGSGGDDDDSEDSDFDPDRGDDNDDAGRSERGSEIGSGSEEASSDDSDELESLHASEVDELSDAQLSDDEASSGRPRHAKRPANESEGPTRRGSEADEEDEEAGGGRGLRGSRPMVDDGTLDVGNILPGKRRRKVTRAVEQLGLATPLKPHSCVARSVSRSVFVEAVDYVALNGEMFGAMDHFSAQEVSIE